MGRRLLPHALVLLTALFACWPALHGSFVYDDAYYVVGNPAVSGNSSAWTTPLGVASQALWRPLTVASFAAQWDGSGRAGPFRAVNVGLHAAVSLALLLVCLTLGLGAGGGLAAALLFAAHPLHAESIAWVSGRAELLAALCVLLAWRAHLSAARPAAPAAALLLAAGMLSKEHAALAPLLFAVMDAARRERRPVPWRRLLLLAGVVAALLLVRAALLPQLLPGDAPFGDLPPGARAVVALNAAGRACLLMVWPQPLRVFYPRQEFLAPHAGWLAVLAGWLALALALRRRQPLAASALLCTPLALLSVLHLVPIGATFAERFLYLPSAFACLAAGALLAAWGRAERRSGRGAGWSVLAPALVLLVAVPLCRRATAVFHDDLSLWEQAAAVAPDAAHARYNHGYFLDAAGRHVTIDRHRPSAADELRQSLRLEPRHAYAGFAHQILGKLALNAGSSRLPDPTAAAHHFRAALQVEPRLVEARLNLASLALAAPGLVDRDEALELLGEVTAASGASPEQREAAQLVRLQLLTPPEPPPADRGAAPFPPPGAPAGEGEAPPASPTGTSSPDGS